MSLENKTNRKRGKEIAQHIAKHPSISKQVIKPAVHPPMTKAGLKKTLGLLVKKGFVNTRKAHGKLFYELAQDLKSRTAAAEYFGCHPYELIVPKVRTAEILHHELCEHWIWTLQRRFPEATFIRAHEIERNELAENILLTSGDAREVFPDFLMVFPKTDMYKQNSVAFEIERTRKSDKRVLNKLRKYARETRIDGLVYICDSARLSETIRRLYTETMVKSGLRIGHYSDFFFLFSNAIVPEADPLANIFNAEGKRIDLFDWVVRLVDKDLPLRRPQQFADLVH